MDSEQMTSYTQKAHNDYITALNSIPVQEITARAKFIALINPINDDTTNGYYENTELGYKRIPNSDGGGNASTLFVLNTGELLLLTYDNESTINFFGFDAPYDYEGQTKLYEGLPPKLYSIVHNQTETYEHLNVESTDGETLYSATGIFYYTPDSKTWSMTAGLEYYLDHSTDIIFSYDHMPISAQVPFLNGNYDREIGFWYTFGNPIQLKSHDFIIEKNSHDTSEEAEIKLTTLLQKLRADAPISEEEAQEAKNQF